MHFSPVIALFAFVAVTSALTAGHHVRAPHHRALAARVASVATVDHAPLKKRANGKRCRPRPSSAVVVASTPKDEPTTTPQTNPTTTTPKVDTPTNTPKDDPPKNDPTTTHKPSPTTHQFIPATTPKSEPTTTKQAPPPPATTQASSGGGLSFLAGVQTGQGTWYSTGLGACGITNNDGQKIAAASHLLFDAFPGYSGINPNTNPMCGRQVEASYNGRSVIVTLTDRCDACQLTDLDFSPSAFQELADLGVGRLSGMTWKWV